MNDLKTGKRIEDLKSLLKDWAKEIDLEACISFKSYQEYFNDEPEDNPCVLIMIASGVLASGLNGYLATDEYSERLSGLMAKTDYMWDLFSNNVVVFYTDNPTLIQEFKLYFEWKWITELIKPNFADLHEELFLFFQKSPSSFYDIKHRQFEILLNEVFRKNGYKTELGKGVGDGGVDLTLFEDPLGDVVTLVQAKKYRADRKIGLEAVAALSGHMYDRNAQKGIFVTTSQYLPGVKLFAERQKKELKLADSSHLVEWCSKAADGIILDKSKLVSNHFITSLLRKSKKNHSKIACSTSYLSGVVNTFYLVLKEAKHSALLMRIPSTIFEDDGYGQRGTNIPDLTFDLSKFKTKENVFRVKKITNKNGVYFWGKKRRIHFWDKKPLEFDFFD